MAGVHLPAAPGFLGWTRLKGGEFKTKVRAEVDEMVAAVEADRLACPTCHGETGMVPSHYTGYARDGEAYTYHCRSGSRWFNPNTRKMEGRAHCTCDACF